MKIPLKMKENVFSIIFKEVSLKQIKQNFLEDESRILKYKNEIENNKITDTCKHFYKKDFHVFL